MTLSVEKSSLEDTLNTLYKLNTTPLDLEALDFAPLPAPTQPYPPLGMGVRTGEGFWLAVRVGGLANGLMPRIERIQQLIGAGEVLREDADKTFWQGARELDWATNGVVTKIPTTPERIKELEGQLGNTARRYSVGGNVAYVAAPFAQDGFSSLPLLGDQSRLITQTQHAFAQRIKQALDPENKFV